MKEELLSIIVPVYNGGAFLRETLDSILSSIYKKIEVLVIDDGSIDDSAAICREYMLYDKRIKYFYQDNKGIVGARNRGLTEAQGKYVTFCDQDDLVNKEHYKIAIQKLQISKGDVYICSTMKIYDSNKKVKRVCEKFKDKLYLKDDILDKFVLPAVLRNKFDDMGDNEIIAKGHIWNCVILKSLIDDNQLSFKKFINFEDDTLMRLDVLLSAERVCTGSDIGYYWRTHMTSKSNKKEYLDSIHLKLNNNREYIQTKLGQKYTEEIAHLYENREKCIDMTLVLDNEISKRRNFKERKNYLSEILALYITNTLEQDIEKLKSGELRYRIILKEILKKRYLRAFYLNKFIVVVRDTLHKMHLTYLIENFLYKK